MLHNCNLSDPGRLLSLGTFATPLTRNLDTKAPAVSKEQRLKLPVDLTAIPQGISAEDKARLEQISQGLLDAKEALKDLERNKGILSRQIGQAKQAGQETEHLKAKLQLIGKAIGEHRATQNQLTKHATQLLDAYTQANANPVTKPAHFRDSPTAVDAPQTDCAIADVSDNDKAAWDQYADNHPGSNLYHRFAFKSIIEKSFGHNTVYLMAHDKNGKVIGILPAVQLSSRLFGNYLVSIPFFNYGGALADRPAIETALMKCLADRASQLGATHIEFRDTHHREGWLQKTEKASLILKLPDNSDSLWADIGSKVRAQIKKAESNDLSIRFGRTELLADFYQVFAINMRDLGTPVYSRRLFEHLISNTELNAEIVVAYHHGKPVSCGFLMGNKDTLEIPWASTLRQANSLNANMFLYWQILKRATEQGYAFFDFGRSSVDAGTFKFKTQWGAQPQHLYWHYWLRDSDELPALNPNNPKYKLAIAVWQRLPVWITKLVGPSLVKNLP